MLKKIKSKIGALTFACGAWMAVAAAYSPVLAGVTQQYPEEVSNKVVDTFKEYLMPIGGVVIFITVVISAFKIMSTANKPQERAEAMTSLPYIALGGGLLGGALLITGLIYGLGMKLNIN